MENITLGQIGDAVIFLATLAGGIGALYGLLMKGIKSQLKPIKDELKGEKMSRLKSDLTTLMCLADNFFEFANNSMGFRIDETIANDLSAFKTWLGNHNTIIYYTAKTPTYTQITGTLKDELEAVWRANSYKGTTNISQVNNDLPFNLSVTALAGETE